MILLVGLGNPGSEYANTRHNVGFMTVDSIVRRHSFSTFKTKFKGLLAEGEIANEKILLLKPETYMNLSGEAVLSVCSFYKIKPENIIVFHDDMDLPIGKIKVKTGGGSGGHNGLKSIDANIGNNYTRVRIGISKPTLKEEVVHFVLSSFSKEEKKELDLLLDRISEFLPFLLQKRSDLFMNKLSCVSKELKNGI